MEAPAAVSDRFEAIDEKRWAAAVAPTIFLSPAWFHSVEGRLTKRQRYAVADSRGDRPAAGAFYDADATTYYFFNPIELLTADETWGSLEAFLDGEVAEVRRLRAIVAKAAPEAAICVSPFGYTQPLRAEASAAQRRAIADELERAASDWGSASAAVLYADAADQELGEELARRGFIPFTAGANCVLDDAGDGLEPYLQRLSAARRSAVRKEMRRFAEHGLTIESADLATRIDELARFQAGLQAKYGHEPDIENERQAFTLIERHLRDFVHVDLVRKESDLVGFVLYFLKDSVLYPKMVGFDDDRLARDDYAYFNATYYNMVKRAAELGVGRIEYGIYAYDVKLTRGCRGERLVSYLRPPPQMASEVQELAGFLSEAVERMLGHYSR